MQIEDMKAEHSRLSARVSSAREVAAQAAESQKAAQKHLAQTRSEAQYWRCRATEKRTRHLTVQTIFSISLGDNQRT
jgi:hypothetical protein